MSSNASLQAQELSSYSRLALGWLKPKIVQQGQNASAYLGPLNYVHHDRRDDPASFTGPTSVEEFVDGKVHEYDVVSTTPEFGEPVYRSVVALTEPSEELVPVVSFPPEVETQAAYTGRFDGQGKALKFSVEVPAEKDQAVFSFDTIYHIETETNFNDNEEQIRVVTDYDIGQVVIAGEMVESFRLFSGDENFDTLNETIEGCEVDRVLALRLKRIAGTLTDEEKVEFTDKTTICQAPTWVTKDYDLSAHAGKTIDIEIRYVTDAGYTEFGIVVDNVNYGDTIVDYEGADAKAGEWKILGNGGADLLTHNQFYLLEYRSPDETFKARNGLQVASLNMDRNLKTKNTQSVFVGEGTTPAEKFRLIEYDYQPGVLAWYYNSKFTDRDNGASVQNGKGYLLVVNPGVSEMVVPGMEDPVLRDANGHYDNEAEPMKRFLEDQRNQFVCFSHTTFATYINGEVPTCAGATDQMLELTKDGKPLAYRREWFNQRLPLARYAAYPVGKPYRNDSMIRTAVSTFRPVTAGPAAPFKVYKTVNGEMVLDEAMTASAQTYPAVAEFKDSENKLASNARFHGDAVVVEKKGFNFKVVEPSQRVAASYSAEVGGENNNAQVRRPRAKVYFSWD